MGEPGGLVPRRPLWLVLSGVPQLDWLPELPLDSGRGPYQATKRPDRTPSLRLGAARRPRGLTPARDTARTELARALNPTKSPVIPGALAEVRPDVSLLCYRECCERRAGT